MAGFLSDDGVRDALWPTLAVRDAAGLDDKWLGIIPRANLEARADVTRAVLLAGLPAETATSDDESIVAEQVESYHRRQALYWCHTLGHLVGAEGAQAEAVKALDCREEMASAIWTVDGVLVEPDEDAVGAVGVGELDFRQRATDPAYFDTTYYPDDFYGAVRRGNWAD